MSQYIKEQQEAAFTESCQRMERLVERLPEMERKNGTWKRLRFVQELIQAREDYDRLTAERAFMEKEEKRYREAGKLGMSAYVQSQMGYRQGPLKEAELRCRELLAKSGFENETQAREWLADCKEEAGQLKQEIEAFQEEYRRTLAECQRLEAGLYGVEEGRP